MLKLVKNGFSLSDKKTSCSGKVKNSTEDNSNELSDQEHVISTLENLLKKAKDGDISGLMYVVATEGDDHGVGIAGEYISNIHTGLAAFCLVYHLLGDELRKSSPLCW